ncbi:MAG: oligopeptidase B, partial [Proteobacteria bacterium]|nr:oligopeptidase B [Pseudomonadota bacterium]
MMAPSEGLQKKLYSEILSRIKESDMEIPYQRGKYMYYSRTEKGKQYRVYCRKLNSNLAKEETILDCNALASGKKFFSLGLMDPSPDSRFLAYTTDIDGFREYTLFFKNLVTGKNFIEKIPCVRSFAWSADNKTIFYVTEDQAKRAHKVWSRVLSERSSEKLIYEEKNKRFSVYVELSRSHEYVFITSSSSSSSEVRFLRADYPYGKCSLFRPRKKNIKYYMDHGKDYFYILTNDKGKNFRLIKTRTAAEKKDWCQMLPHRKSVMLDNIEVFADFIVLHERKNGFPRLRLLDLRTGNAREIHLKEMARTVGASKNFNFTTDCYRYEYESYVTPETTFEYCLGKSESTILKRRAVGRDYSPKQYTVDIIKAKANDGTLIPISMVYRSDLKQAHPQAFLLNGYGAYGYSNDAYFSVPRLSLLDRGLIFGTAHIRGGGEFGKKWHEQGSLLKKKNSFTDFIACADALFAA